MRLKLGSIFIGVQNLFFKEVLFMKNQQQEKNLNNAQDALYQVNQIAQKLKNQPEFAAELGSINELEQAAKSAQQEVNNAKNQNQ